MKQQPRFSDCISNFLNMVQDAETDYEWNYEEVHRLDEETQDLLHTLELENPCYKETAKIGTKLKRCRQLRRESKDTTLILQPLIDFIDSDKGRQAINLMKEMLGKTRKAEDMMTRRVYRFRTKDGEVLQSVLKRE